jgi:hypothetical protein
MKWNFFFVIVLTGFSTYVCASNLEVKCADRVPPSGGDDDIGRAAYLNMEQTGNGGYTLTYKTGCKYAETSEECRSKTSTWNLTQCDVSKVGEDMTWICSIANGQKCFFARYSPKEPREYFLKGLFEFTSFRACWLPASNGNWTNFHSSGGLAGCTLSP